jgi:micrococcal nuclease
MRNHNKLLAICAFFCLAAIINLTSTADSEKGHTPGTYAKIFRVIHVKDGDSFDALNAQQEKITIRLFGIDCPERSQGFSEQAKQFTKRAILNKSVNLKEIGKDRYGRILAKVSTDHTSQDLNQQLVAQGLCRWYERYAAEDQELKQLELNARAQRLGIWSLKNQIAPWDFRAQEREYRLGK